MTWVPLILGIVQGVVGIIQELARPAEPRPVFDAEMAKLRRDTRKKRRLVIRAE